MPIPVYRGLVDSRLIDKGGIEYVNLSNDLLEKVFQTGTFFTYKAITITISNANFTQGNPSRILLEQNAVFATFPKVIGQEQITNFRKQGYFENAIAFIFTQNWDLLRISGETIWGRTVNDNGNLVIYLYRNYELNTNFTGSIPSGTQLTIFVPFNEDIYSLQNGIPETRYPILSINRVREHLENLWSFTGSNGSHQANFHNINNLNSANNLFDAIQRVNANVIGNLNSLLTNNKSSVIDAINELTAASNLTLLPKGEVIGGIFDADEINWGTSTINLGSFKLFNYQDSVVYVFQNVNVQILSNMIYYWTGNGYITGPAIPDDIPESWFLFFCKLIQGNWNYYLISWDTGNNVPYSILNIFSQEDYRYNRIAYIKLARQNGNYEIRSLIDVRNLWRKASVDSPQLFSIWSNQNSVPKLIFYSDSDFEFILQRGNLKISYTLENNKIIEETNVGNINNTKEVSASGLLDTYSVNNSNYTFLYRYTFPNKNIRIEINPNISLQNDNYKLELLNTNLLINNIQFQDTNNTTLPAGYNSILHVLNDYGQRGIKEIQKIVITSGTIDQNGNYVSTVPFPGDLVQARNIFLFVNGIYYNTSFDINDLSEDTVIIMEINGNIAFKNQQGFVSTDRITIVYQLS